jgi:twitching motility protein PilT
MSDISELLAFGVSQKASDLHLSADMPPMLRIHGDVKKLDLAPLDDKMVQAMVYDIMNDSQRKFFDENSC